MFKIMKKTKICISFFVKKGYTVYARVTFLFRVLTCLFLVKQ